MQTRIEPEDPNSFPFSAFNLELREMPIHLLERFGEEVGQYVRRLHFGALLERDRDSKQVVVDKVVVLLRHTPNLVEIELTTSDPVHINKGHLVGLPQSFPRLRVITQYDLKNGFAGPTPPDSIDFLSFLITRSTRLSEIKFMSMQETQNFAVEENPGLGVIRTLLKYHREHIPFIGLKNLNVSTPMLRTIQELMSFNLPVRHLGTSLFLNDPENANQLNMFSSLLSSLSTNLQTLLLSISSGPALSPNCIIPVPVLPELTRFVIIFDQRPAHPEGVREIRFIFAPNQFPMLRKFSIISFHPHHYSSTTMTFQSGPLPSVQEFQLNCGSFILESSPWSTILPQLRSIHLGEIGSTVGNLSYILRYFYEITALRLHNASFQIQEDDFWSVLTGGAPRPLNRDDLLHGELSTEAGELPDHVDGVYQLASLRNLRGKSYGRALNQYSTNFS